MILKNKLKFLFFLFLITFAHPASSLSEKDVRALIAKTPAKNFSSYNFHKDSPVSDRIKTSPDLVLDFLKKLDNRPVYEIYRPSSRELQIFRDSLDKLPPFHKKILRERLLAIYFIKNFLGSGLTDWVVDKNDKIYTFIAFNANVFQKSFSELLSYKANTVFRKDSGDYKLVVESNCRLNGFYYILLHEATHAVDYTMNLTPYVDPEIRFIQPHKAGKHTFTSGIWKTMEQPVAKYNFPLREKLSFYGMKGGPHINISEAPKVYQGLAKSPFVSLYGSTNWAEDLVELVIFYHLTHYLKNSYRIKIFHHNDIIFNYEPMNSKAVQARTKALEIIYR